MYQLTLTEEELLALTEAVLQIEDHSNWLPDVLINGDLLPGIYSKIYELANPVIDRMHTERYGKDN